MSAETLGLLYLNLWLLTLLLGLGAMKFGNDWLLLGYLVSVGAAVWLHLMPGVDDAAAHQLASVLDGTMDTPIHTPHKESQEVR